MMKQILSQSELTQLAMNTAANLKRILVMIDDDLESPLTEEGFLDDHSYMDALYDLLLLFDRRGTDHLMKLKDEFEKC